MVFCSIRCDDDTSLSNNVKSGEFERRSHFETMLINFRSSGSLEARKGVCFNSGRNSSILLYAPPNVRVDCPILEGDT